MLLLHYIIGFFIETSEKTEQNLEGIIILKICYIKGKIIEKYQLKVALWCNWHHHVTETQNFTVKWQAQLA